VLSQGEPVNIARNRSTPAPRSKLKVQSLKPRAIQMSTKVRGAKPNVSAYVDGLRMLGRRELSEKQVRERLLRKGHEEEEVTSAIDRLRAGRAIDDARVAEAIAHTATVVHRRGRLRVKRQIEQAGIAPATARQALDAVFDGVSDEELLEAALAKRLRGRDHIADEKEFRRVFRHLIGQGFEPERVLAALKRRGNARSREPEA
jgi:regulatory protein